MFSAYMVLSSGMVPSLVGVSHVVIQLPLYEQIKYYMAKKGNLLLVLIFGLLINS